MKDSNNNPGPGESIQITVTKENIMTNKKYNELIKFLKNNMKKQDQEPSEQIQIFKVIREHNKAERLERQKQAQIKILKLCNDNSVELDVIQPYQLRLSKKGLKIDLFPQKKSYHIITNGMRGSYSDIEEFFNTYFKS